jgi:hypothetical protein
MHLVATLKGGFGKLSKCSIHYKNQQVQLEGVHVHKESSFSRANFVVLSENVQAGREVDGYNHRIFDERF